MIKILKYSFILLLGFCLTSYAALDLELTHGVDQAIPTAIIPFANGDDLVKVINADLTNSGYFNINTADAETDANNYDYWRAQKINYVIAGNVTPINNNYLITFKLVDIYNMTNLIEQQVTITKSQRDNLLTMRALAHHISDLIYQQITGIPGVFSTRIAYVLVNRQQKHPYKLMIADADGYNPQTMLQSLEPIMSPAWSPRGKEIAYVSFEGNRSSIYLQNVATGKRELVSKFPGINGAPAWSPDGTKLALVLTKTGYPKIYILDLQTKKFTQMTFGSSLDTEPAWSPDGKTIIFTSDRGGAPQIYQLVVTTKKVQRITYQGNYNARASFTPDGKSIVMLHRDQGMFNIAVQNLESDRVTILTKSGMDESPSVAPNGQMVVYATNYDGKGILSEVSTDGRVQLRLPAQDGEVQEPAWSP